MKAEPILTHFAGTSGTLGFDEKSVLETLLDFTPYWVFKPTNAIYADSRGVYTSEKTINLSRKNGIHMNCKCIDGSITDGLPSAILFTLVLYQRPGYKLFCEPETIHFKKVNNSVLNLITIFLEDDINEEVNFKEEMLTFTLQLLSF